MLICHFISENFVATIYWLINLSIYAAHTCHTSECLLWVLQKFILSLTFSFRWFSIGNSHLCTTCLFTRLEGSLAWSQHGLWQLSFCRNCDLWSLCYDGGTKVGLFFILFLEESRYALKYEGCTYLDFLFPNSSNVKKSCHISLPQQRLNKSTVSAESGLSETLLGQS